MPEVHVVMNCDVFRGETGRVGVGVVRGDWAWWLDAQTTFEGRRVVSRRSILRDGDSVQRYR